MPERGTFDAAAFDPNDPTTWPAGPPEPVTFNGEPLELFGAPVTLGGRYADGDYWIVTTAGEFQGMKVEPGGRIVVRL